HRALATQSLNLSPFSFLRVNAQRRWANSFDHGVGAGKQYLRDHEAESLRRPEIDHKLKFRRCLHRKIRRLGAADNAAHVLRCAPSGGSSNFIMQATSFACPPPFVVRTPLVVIALSL